MDLGGPRTYLKGLQETQEGLRGGQGGLERHPEVPQRELEGIGRRIATFNSGIGYRILSRHTDWISDIGYRISESDIITQMMKKPLDGNAKLKQKTV